MQTRKTACCGALFACALPLGSASCRSGGGALALEPCSASAESGDGRTIFAMTANSQLKMPRMGNYCVTVAGDGASDADAAQGADLTATSSSAQHAAKNIGDGDAQSYWASGSDPTGPVDVQLDFGTVRQIKSIEIDWEHPAQALATRLAACSPSRARHSFERGLGIRVASGHWERMAKHTQHNW